MRGSFTLIRVSRLDATNVRDFLASSCLILERPSPTTLSGMRSYAEITSVQDDDTIVVSSHISLHESNAVVFENLFHRAVEIALGMRERNVRTLCAGVGLHDDGEAECLCVAICRVNIALRADCPTPLIREERLSAHGRVAHLAHEEICVVFILRDVGCADGIEVQCVVPEVRFPPLSNCI